MAESADLFTPATQRYTARAAFSRVWNLRSIAVVFYFCLLLILGRFLVPIYHEPLSEMVFTLARGVRQTMISGLLLLFVMALTEAFVVARGLKSPYPLMLGLLTCALAAAISAPLRTIVAGYPLMQYLGENRAFLMSTFVLWTVVGTLAYWLFSTTREDDEERAKLVDSECRRECLQSQMVEANLSALQAQIEPHFLFNTLANVKRLYQTTPAEGREMLASLINYLRAALPSMRQSGSTLGRELELARSFLTILKMRMRERLHFSIEREASLDNARVPPMILPTLVENAIKHGLAHLPEGGRIDIRAAQEGDDLVVEVRDDGVGFSGEAGSGVGLANTRSRLAALFGSRAGLRLESGNPRGVRASFRLPLDLSPPLATEGVQ